MRRPVIALEGVSGLYNYGCEAIVRGTLAALRRTWPDCAVRYVSYRPAEDRRVLRDVNVEVIQGVRPIPLAKRLANAALRRLGLSFRLAHQSMLRWLPGVDCVLSIGGDMYTLWPGEESATSFGRVERAHKIMDAGTRLVLWGASVGPFEVNPRAREAFRAVLEKMPLVTVREAITFEYLQSLGLRDRIVRVADPAFLMDCSPPDVQRDSLIGVNLSPLSLIYAYGNELLDDATAVAVSWLARLVEALDRDVLLVPHVICPWRPEDDDYGFLLGVLARLPAALQPRVELLPPGLGARRTKQVLGSCSLVVAARMHCAIAALSMAVPTLLLSYSPKARGMCDYVYGTDDWVLPVTSEPDHLLSTLALLHERRSEVRDLLRDRLPAIRADAASASHQLSRVIS